MPELIFVLGILGFIVLSGMALITFVLNLLVHAMKKYSEEEFPFE